MKDKVEQVLGLAKQRVYNAQRTAKLVGKTMEPGVLYRRLLAEGFDGEVANKAAFK